MQHWLPPHTPLGRCPGPFTPGASPRTHTHCWHGRGWGPSPGSSCLFVRSPDPAGRADGDQPPLPSSHWPRTCRSGPQGGAGEALHSGSAAPGPWASASSLLECPPRGDGPAPLPSSPMPCRLCRSLEPPESWGLGHAAEAGSRRAEAGAPVPRQRGFLRPGLSLHTGQQ